MKSITLDSILAMSNIPKMKHSPMRMQHTCQIKLPPASSENPLIWTQMPTKQLIPFRMSISGQIGAQLLWERGFCFVPWIQPVQRTLKWEETANLSGHKLLWRKLSFLQVKKSATVVPCVTSASTDRNQCLKSLAKFWVHAHFCLERPYVKCMCAYQCVCLRRHEITSCFGGSKKNAK